MRAGRPRKPMAVRLEPIGAIWTWDRHGGLQRRLSDRLRQRLYRALMGKERSGSAVRDLGCTMRELVAYLERKFLPGMSWSNYGVGLGKWCVDHITPISSVDLTNRERLLRVCHYSNLQPLWFQDNSSKGNQVLV